MFLWPCRRSTGSMSAKSVYYALDEAEKTAIMKPHGSPQKAGSKINVVRFKGLGEMNPMQLRETTMAPDTRRLVMALIKSLEKKSNVT
jgi:topoisomerase-4 subunit B